MKQRNKAIPAVYLLLMRDGKVLVARRCNTGYEDGNYQVPAGHVEEGELPREALVREAKEEIGIDLKADDLELVHTSYLAKHDETDNRADFYFKATKWSGEIRNAEPEKCDELGWSDPDDLPPNTTAHVRRAIQDAQKGILYSELGKDFLKEHGLYLL